MDFKEIKKDFIIEMKKNLLNSFRDEKNYKFLKNNKTWQKLAKQ